MTKRGNSEGSIYRCSHGYGAYAWIDTPDGRRQRKYVYGKTREDVRERWLKLARQVQRVKGSLVRRPTKTEASDAYLPLPGMCVRALEGRREEQEWHRAALQDEAERLGPLRRAPHVRVAFAPW